MLMEESSEVQKGYACASISSVTLSYKQNTLICITRASPCGRVCERGHVLERDRGSKKEVCILWFMKYQYTTTTI